MELCLNAPAATLLPGFVRIQDGTIRCAPKGQPIELVYDCVFTLNESRTVLRAALAPLLGRLRSCRLSCGTHVHMSQRGVDSTSDPDFTDRFQAAWLRSHQQRMIDAYYGEARRPRVQRNTEIGQVGGYKKGYEPMLNVRPNSPGQPYHLEFRALPSVGDMTEPGRVLGSYLRDLHRLWTAVWMQEEVDEGRGRRGVR